MDRRTQFLYYGLPVAMVGLAVAGVLIVSRDHFQHLVRVPAVHLSSAQHGLPDAADPAPMRAGGGVAIDAPIVAVGRLAPHSDEVSVGARLAGIVDQVKVSPGQAVKAGDVLFVLDQRAANAALELRRADLASAERRRDETAARADSIQAQIEAARANTAVARAEFDERIEHVRAGESLLAKGGAHTISPGELARRRNTQRTAEGRWQETQARVAQLEAELKLIEVPNGPTYAVEVAAVELARRTLDRAQVDLALLTVHAPIDGTIMQVNVRPGEYAASGSASAPPIVLGDLDRLHVRVDIPEADVARFSASAPAFARLHAAAERMQLEFVRVEPMLVNRAMAGGSDAMDAPRMLRVVYRLPKVAIQAYAGQQVDAYIDSVSPRIADGGPASEPFPWP